MYIHIYMYTCIWNVYIYICIYIFVYICIFIYTYICIHVRIRVHIHLWIILADASWVSMTQKFQTPKDFKTLLHVKSSTCVFCEQTATHSRAHTYTHTHRRVRFQMWVNVLQTHEKCNKITTFSMNVWRWKDTCTYVYQWKKTYVCINEEIHKYVSEHETMHIHISSDFLTMKIWKYIISQRWNISRWNMKRYIYMHIFINFLKRCIHPHLITIYCHLLMLYIFITYCIFASAEKTHILFRYSILSPSNIAYFNLQILYIFPRKYIRGHSSLHQQVKHSQKSAVQSYPIRASWPF